MSRPPPHSRYALPPLSPTFADFTLYETRANFYLVTSPPPPTTEAYILKIGRTSPRELEVTEDGTPYGPADLADVLAAIDAGNKATGGLNRVSAACGLLGFVRFLEGYYMVLVTERAEVGAIGPHRVYKIASTQLVYLPHPSVRIHALDEGRYTSIFAKIELVHDFFFSYTYDLSHSLQHNMKAPYARSDLLDAGVPLVARDHGGYAAADPVFSNPFASFPDESTWVWNLYLLKDVWPLLTHKHWVLPVIHGFFSQRVVTIFDRPLVLTLLARRSRFYAGTRYNKRGVSDRGRVGNEVETEQIVADAGVSTLAGSAYTSFVMLRGSIPVTWSQEQSIVTPKPPIVLHSPDPFYAATAAHFEDVFRRYGAPVLVLNLVKQREKVPREQIIGSEFAAAVSALNASLPPPLRIRYAAFDMHRAAKTRGADVIGQLHARATDILAHTGFFHAGYEPARNAHEAARARSPAPALGGAPYPPDRLGREQRGVARFNCIDSLDRTNAAQFVLGKLVLGHQMYALGLADSPFLDFDSALMDTFTTMYESMGDHIALQYGGSQLNHRVATYRDNTWSSYSRDMMTAIRRYYSNSFTDAEKQEAMNLFLGLYVPLAGKKHLWAIDSDHFLHNSLVPRFVAPRLRAPPSLPLPSLVDCIRHQAAYATRALAARAAAAAALAAAGASLPTYDSFALHHATHRLTALPDHAHHLPDKRLLRPPKAASRTRRARARARNSAPDDAHDARIYVSPLVKAKGIVDDSQHSTIERLGGVSRWMRMTSSMASTRSAAAATHSPESAFPSPAASHLAPLRPPDAALYATAAATRSTASLARLSPASSYAPAARLAYSNPSVHPASTAVYANYASAVDRISGNDRVVWL